MKKIIIKNEETPESTSFRIKKLREIATEKKFLYTIKSDTQIIDSVVVSKCTLIIDSDSGECTYEAYASIKLNDELYGDVAIQWADTAATGRAIFKTGYITEGISVATDDEINFNESALQKKNANKIIERGKRLTDQSIKK